MHGLKPLSLLFVANWGPETGLGHFVRCQAIAAAVSKFGVECSVLGPSTPPKIKGESPFLDHSAFSVLDGSDLVGELATFFRTQSFNFLVIDDYRFGEAEQVELKGQGIRWFQFDPGPPTRMSADIVADVRPTFDAAEISGRLKSPEIQVLGGPGFAPIRACFSELATRERDGVIRRVLVTFGGGDDRGAINFVVRALCTGSFERLVFVLVVGSGNPRLADIEQSLVAYSHCSVELYVDPGDIAEVFNSCDVAIMAGGSSTFEVAHCGIPMLLLSIAANQVNQSQAWANRGGAFYLGSIEDEPQELLLEKLNDPLLNPLNVQRMGRINQQVGAGGGALRIAEVIFREMQRGQ